MKKGIFIVAGVLLVGGVAYLFLKNKNKVALLKDEKSADLQTATTGVATGTTGSTTPKDEIVFNKVVEEISPSSLSSLQAVVYANKYPDISSRYGGNLQKIKDHWIKYGKEEKRTIPTISNSIASPTQLTDEQALIYLAKYPDLVGRYGVDIQKAKDHWLKYGIAEKRTIDIVV